jgi:hypothetical protein
MMKKGIIFLATGLCLLYVFTSTGLAQDGVDLGKEGMKLLEASQTLIADGKLLQACTGQDRAKMVDKGTSMIKKGEDIMSAGEMMLTDPGRSNMQAISRMMTHGGDVLLKKGKQEAELSAKDTAEVNKLGKSMISFGELMLKKGKVMSGG